MTTQAFQVVANHSAISGALKRVALHSSSLFDGGASL